MAAVVLDHAHTRIGSPVVLLISASFQHWSTFIDFLKWILPVS